MTKHMRVNRRRFLTLGGAGAGALLCARSPRVAASAQEPVARPNDPDWIIVNAKVYTVDDRLPKAEAFAIKGGRFQAVGSSSDIRNLARRGTPIFDAQQMTIVPGFIDCHNHAEGEVLLYEVLVGDPFEVKFVSVDSIIEKLRKKAGETPAGTWVEGYFFDDTKVSDKRQLNVHDLDKVSTQHPVVVHHRGGHTGFYNSKALQLAGITKDTPNPLGGTFDRDKSGELNDYSVCTTWGVVGGKYYLLDVFRRRLDYPDLKRAVWEQARRYRNPKVLIEDKGSGTQLIQELKREGLLYIRPYLPPTNTDKIVRLFAQSHHFESGKVLLPSSASWLDDYRRELTSFPGSKHDDQVDSTTQALHYMASNTSLEVWAKLGRGF